MIKLNILGGLLLLFPLANFAQAPALQLQPAQSMIEFTGVQNGAPVSGKFTKFTGDVHFDPNKLNESAVKITVDINSMTMSFQDAVQTLKASDWFNEKMFPQAAFQSRQFKKIDDSHYAVTGDLTIRDKTLPMTIDFTLTENTPSEMKLKGETIVKRTQFGVGQGDWADTNEIKDDVKVDFNFVLKR